METAHSNFSEKPAIYADAKQPRLVVLGDFGRDAANRFCHEFTRMERQIVVSLLPENSMFYDEYRRTSIYLIGDLSYIKRPLLATYKEKNELLDDSVLLGFPNGPKPKTAAKRMAVLLFENIAGALLRGESEFIVSLPCNTLAPASHALQAIFSDANTLMQVITESNPELTSMLEACMPSLKKANLVFPTVPQAVAQVAQSLRAHMVLPLGTSGVAASYEQQAKKLGKKLSVITLKDSWQKTVLQAIEASVDGAQKRQDKAQTDLEMLVQEAKNIYGRDLLAVEACTDLNYGIGVNSNTCYAAYIARLVYPVFFQPTSRNPYGILINQN